MEERLVGFENFNDVKTFVMVEAHVFYKNYEMFITIMNLLLKNLILQTAQNEYHLLIIIRCRRFISE